MSLIIIVMSKKHGIAASEGRVIVRSPLTNSYEHKEGINKTFSLYGRRIIGVQCGQMSTNPANDKTVIDRITEIANALDPQKTTAKRVAEELINVLLPELTTAYANNKTESVHIGLAEKGNYKKQATIVELNLHPLSKSHEKEFYYSNDRNPAFYCDGDRSAKKAARDYISSIQRASALKNSFSEVKRVCKTALKIGCKECSSDPDAMIPVCNEEVFTSVLF